MAGKDNGNKESEKERLEREEREQRYEKNKIERSEGMPPVYNVMYGQEGQDLAEVSRLTRTEAVIFSIQVMQEDLTSAERLKSGKRASKSFREAFEHHSIAIDGEGREDLKIIGQQALETQTLGRGEFRG